MANVRIVTGAQGSGFTGPRAASLKTVNVVSTGPTGGQGTDVHSHKMHNQIQPAQHVPGIEPTLLLAPTGTAGIPTLIIAGFAGPA